MKIEFDDVKRNRTLHERGLDFFRAKEIFAGLHLTSEDVRKNYGERRLQTAGWLDGCIVIFIWTPRGAARRIISMRKANDRERRILQLELDRPG